MNLNEVVIITETASDVIVNTTGPAVGAITETVTTGFQGPPGLQNVRVQTTAPANPNLNDIWIQI